MIRHTSAINKYAYYVHYFASNFTRQQKLPSQNALSSYAIQRVRSMSGTLKSGISSQVKQEYANTISALYGREIQNGVQITAQDVKKTQVALEQILTEQVKEFTTADRIQWKTGRVLNGKPQGKLIQRGASIQQTQYLTDQQLLNLQILIDDLQSQIVKLGSKANTKEFQLLKERLNQVQNMITQIQSQQDAELRTLKGWNPGMFGAKTDTTQRYNIGTANRKLLQNLNESIKECQLKGLVIARAQGQLGENIAALAADVVNGIGVSQICKTITENVTGANDSNLQFTIQGMPLEVYEKVFLADTKIVDNQNGVLYSTSVSKGKVDAVIKLPIDQHTTGFKKVHVSMKSVDLSHDIHLVSGTNLWYLLQDEGVKSFLRPYLNIMADHDLTRNRQVMPKTVYGVAKELDAIKKINQLRQDAFLATKIITAYKALSGNTFGRSAAQLFIVNDVSTSQVYVLEINDIIRAIMKEVALNSSVLDDYFTFNYGLEELILDNSWQDTLDARMANLILDARSKRLFIAMRSNALRNNLSKYAIIS